MHSEDRLAAAGAGMGDGLCGLATRRHASRIVASRAIRNPAQFRIDASRRPQIPEYL
jgi:hypothetical protein